MCLSLIERTHTLTKLVTPTSDRTFYFGLNMPKRKTHGRLTCKTEPEEMSVPYSPTPQRPLQVGATPVGTAPHAQSLKLPEFWEASPAAWFAHTESQFDLHGVADDNRRYHHVVTALPSSVATRIVGLLTRPPALDKYTTLKTQLLYNFSLSNAERADELFALNGLGGREPSQLMEHMLALLGDNEPGFLFTHLFLRQLPVSVRSALADVPVGDLRAFAIEVDKFWIAQRGSGGSSPIPAYTSPAPHVRKNKTANVGPSCPVQRPDVCFYHERFGDRATKCRQPCSFAVQGNALAGAR